MRILILFFTIISLASCKTEPQLLIAGKDECYFCKMPYADTKFGAEIITVKGKIYKFDDIGCLLKFLKGGLRADEKIGKIYTVRYNNSKTLTAINDVVLLKSA